MTNSLNEVQTSLKPDEISLLPCPFCGGNPDIHARHWTNGNHEWWISCIKCFSETTIFDNPEEAIEAWNTRVERTCKPTGEWVRISQTQLVKHKHCICGYELGMDEHDEWPFDVERLEEMPNYCPACGAKVVEE